MRRFAFELKMQDKSAYLLAADSESEMEEWISTLNKILHSSFELAMQEKRNGDLHDGLCLTEYVGFHYWTTQTTTTLDMTADNTKTSNTSNSIINLCTESHIPSVQSNEISQAPGYTMFWFIFAQWSTCIIWSV